ncbi:MAG: PAS domain-containing protein [Rhizomicrobium sp.]
MAHFDQASAANAVEAMGFGAANRRLARYWLSAWNGDVPPTRGDILPSKIKDLLSGIAIVELRKDGVAYCRLAGSAICMAIGIDITGRDILTLTPPEFRAERRARYDRVTSGAISRCVKRLRTRFNETILVEDIQLPLSGVSEGGIGQLLYHADWRPKTMDRSAPEILRGLGTEVDETVCITKPLLARAAS